MKRRIVVALIMLCIVAACLLPAANAAGTVYFSVINNKILPLNDATMPAYIGGRLYLPYSFFNSEELGVYSNGGDKTAIIYAGAGKRLTFYAATGEIFDQNDIQYYLYNPEVRNGIVYVPVQLVCDFFGFTYGVTQAEPAAIVRVRTSSNHIPDSTFAAQQIFKNQMQSIYDAYMGITPASPSPTPSESAEPTYPDISVYLSFFDLSGDLSGGKLKSILDALGSFTYKACFFVTADEIEANTDLLRRAACQGHTIGIRLTDATGDGAYKEYKAASALLFEAAQVKTVIVTALGDNEKTGEEMAKAKSLIFWQPTKIYDAGAKLTAAGLTGRLSTVKGTRESLYFACTEGVSGVLRPFLSYLSQYEYSVRRVTETSIPVMTAMI